MSTQRSLVVWERADDLLTLKQNGFNFVVAKSVTGRDGRMSFNIIWQSKALAPRINISWSTRYALNWTVDVPDASFTVTAGGIWQECEPGEAYDITPEGLWTSSTTSGGTPGWLTVGTNGYGSPGSPGIHIVVGCWDGSDFQPIWIDKVPLGVNMTSRYQPQEKLQWWYQSGVQSATMISDTSSIKNEANFSAPNPTTGKYYLSTTYNYVVGKWLDSPTPPPSATFTGVLQLAPPSNDGPDTTNGHSPGPSSIAPLSDAGGADGSTIKRPSAAPSYIWWPVTRDFTVQPAPAPPQVLEIKTKVKADLSIKYKNVEVAFAIGRGWSVTYGPPKGASNDSESAFRGRSNIAEDDLAKVLEGLKNQGLISSATITS